MNNLSTLVALVGTALFLSSTASTAGDERGAMAMCKELLQEKGYGACGSRTSTSSSGMFEVKVMGESKRGICTVDEDGEVRGIMNE